MNNKENNVRVLYNKVFGKYYPQMFDVWKFGDTLKGCWKYYSDEKCEGAVSFETLEQAKEYLISKSEDEVVWEGVV